VYGWGGRFEVYRLLENIRALAIAFGLDAAPRDVPPKVLDHYFDPTSQSRDSIYELAVPLYWTVSGVGSVLALTSVDLVVLPIPPADNKLIAPVGLALYPRAVGSAELQFNITPSVTFDLKGDLVSEALVRAEIRPSGAGVFFDPALNTQISGSATLDGKPPDPWILLGRKPGTRLELSHAHTALKAKADSSDFELIVELAADAGALILDFGEGDGFLSTILKGSQKMEFGLGFSWSSKTGLHFNGQAGLEATIGIHASLAGLLNLDSLYIAFHAKSDPAGASLIVAATGGVSIGPVVATVKKVGVSLDLLPVKKGDPGGNLGLANVGFGFKPPEGISVALSAPAVSGVGFLDIDTEHHQYLGAIAISVGDIDISAVGVLNTKLPTGPGYSLIVVVSASFPPIELGFGFDLTGIGGLVGVNRTVDVPGLQALARSGGLDELMFPEDLIHKAPQVAASLAAVFPPALQHFLIGPAVRLEWGADGILDAQIGVLIELSDAGGGISILRIALLGFFHITLPQAEAPVAD
ncbi:MAG TPA: DUF6603 domain-containing protein, partial [Candidatus Dormibacteraeota bacterium]|nr:DUF6603 domain-containing protein [Candidatus Dormibacteraeota bacterium]